MKRRFFLAVLSLASLALLSCNNDNVSLPIMNLTTGTYSTDIEVTISSPTAETTIYYTTDGTNPTQSSSVYSNPIAIGGDGTVMVLKAIAIKHLGYNITLKSEVAVETYFINYGGSSSPQVTDVNPDNNSTQIDVATTVTATFSAAMNPDTITVDTFTLQHGTTLVEGAVYYSGTTATFTPTEDLEPNTTYIAILSDEIEDDSGNPLAGSYVWVFTTARDYEAWLDIGIIYEDPAGTRAYYPSVLYDADGFGEGTPKYLMWYSDGNGATYQVESSNGFQWSSSPTAMVGINGSHHVQVLYDADCFGVTPCTEGVTAKYRIWFWDSVLDYVIEDMVTAKSTDGVTWTDKTTVTQDPSAKIIEGFPSSEWNRGTYGPVSLHYQAVATNTGTEPWDYSYVMYYDGTDGGNEDTGLAYSTDGLYWRAYTGNPVLNGTEVVGDWDSCSAVYGTVFSDAAGFHYIYSGKTVCGSNFIGLGYAHSTDGKTWVRSATNPIFHISDENASYRSNRLYAPSIIDDGSGVLKMYYSARGSTEPIKIGMAVLH